MRPKGAEHIKDPGPATWDQAEQRKDSSCRNGQDDFSKPALLLGIRHFLPTPASSIPRVERAGIAPEKSLHTALQRPLTSARQFIGVIDATRDSARPTARCLEQLQGAQRSSIAVIVPMGATARMAMPELVVVITSALAGAFVVALLLAERFTPWLFA